MKLREYLAQPPSNEQDLKESLEKYTQILQGFATDERVEQLSTEALMSSTEEVKAWSESKTSQLLVLAGQNEPSTLERDDLSWISSAAVGFMQHLRDNRETVVLFLCQESSWQPKDILPQEIISSLLYQLLQKEPQVLQDESYASLSAQLEGRDICTLDLKVLVDLMIWILQLPRNGKRIYILLDRVDRCREESVRKVALLIALARVVTRSKSIIVKILVVVNTLYWNSFERDWEALKNSEFYDSQILRLYRRDQQMVSEIRACVIILSLC
jgi:hypothetical protein